jgi:hypothetical protein
VKVAVDPPPGRLLALSGHYAVTDANGHYRVSGIQPGIHTVVVENLIRHWPSTGTSVKVLTRLHEVETVDFGFYQPLAVYLPLVRRSAR